MNESDRVSDTNQTAAGFTPGQFTPEGLQRDRASAPSVTAPIFQLNSAAVKGFFGSLFDFSFNHFITGKLIRFLYFIFIALSVLFTIFIILSAFGAGASLGSSGIGTLIGILALIVSPILFLLVVTYARVALELVMVLFKIEEHLAARR